MKKIFLVRHGKAVQRNEKKPDFQRNLVKKGENESGNIAKKIRKLGISPDFMVSSSANRALETAHIFAQNLKYQKNKIMVTDKLYEEINEESSLNFSRSIDDKYNSIMLFGHDPTFSDFASYLVKDFDKGMPKSGVVGIEFRVKSWKEISKGTGKLLLFEFPKRISKMYKKIENELIVELSKNIQETMEKLDAQSANKAKKSIKKTSEILAKNFVKTMKASKIKEKEAIGREKTQKAIQSKSTEARKKRSIQVTKPAQKINQKQSTRTKITGSKAKPSREAGKARTKT